MNLDNNDEQETNINKQPPEEEVEDLLDECEKLLGYIDQLNAENQHLTDTIVKYNLGKINKERKDWIQQIHEAEDKEKKSERLIQEYNDKVKQINIMYKNVNVKQSSVNKYIKDEADKITEELYAKINKNKEIYEKEMNRQRNMHENELNEQRKYYRKIIICLIIILVCAIVGCIIGVIM